MNSQEKISEKKAETKNFNNPVGRVCRIHHICAEEHDSSNEYPWYDITQSDSEVPVMLELWRMREYLFIAVVPRATLDRSGTIYQPLLSGRIWHKVNF